MTTHVPTAALMPLVCGVTMQLLGSRMGDDRVIMLALTLGVGVFVHVFYGWLLGHVGAAFLLAVAVSACVIGVVIQARVSMIRVHRCAHDRCSLHR